MDRHGVRAVLRLGADAGRALGGVDLLSLPFPVLHGHLQRAGAVDPVLEGRGGEGDGDAGAGVGDGEAVDGIAEAGLEGQGAGLLVKGLPQRGLRGPGVVPHHHRQDGGGQDQGEEGEEKLVLFDPCRHRTPPVLRGGCRSTLPAGGPIPALSIDIDARPRRFFAKIEKNFLGPGPVCPVYHGGAGKGTKNAPGVGEHLPPGAEGVSPRRPSPGCTGRTRSCHRACRGTGCPPPRGWTPP